MNKSSHVLMGKFLYEYVKKKFGICLDRESFILGNVLPDFRLSFLTRPHFLENNIDYVGKEVQKLLHVKQKSADIGKNHSKHLGIICHYYADFFCFAHSRTFSCDIFTHIQYEKDLHQYFLDRYGGIHKADFIPEGQTAIDAGTVYQKFCKLHTDYLEAEPSFDNDLMYAIFACVEAIMLITSTSVIEIADELPLCYSSLQAI